MQAHYPLIFRIHKSKYAHVVQRRCEVDMRAAPCT
jgi:hypothetical protein